MRLPVCDDVVPAGRTAAGAVFETLVGWGCQLHQSARPVQEQRRQLRTVHAAPIVDGDRLPLGTVLGQHAQQIRDAKVLAVPRDQGVQAIPPCPIAAAARHGQPGVRPATSPRVIEPRISAAPHRSAPQLGLPTNCRVHKYLPP
jgi:hypothetical protein